MTLDRSGWKIRARLQARRAVQSCPDANMQAVWVLAVSDDIISGHNGILTPDHGKALSEVMSMIDLYRNQLPADAVKQAQQLQLLEQQAEASLLQTESVEMPMAETASELATTTEEPF